ncbi:MmgE/PrpD family protein [Frankia sp. R82]|uniref:MmgE/PrpD family protein n=1 Tax=Frankia sp. R82 TaxID=2950553 RepID=UPI002044B1CA|nr:MmgE/PrpD family protein [Frankia sp. R82]MCM3886694.1 MmgE/PrpD family protein [Frankia sp. R82]
MTNAQARGGLLDEVGDFAEHVAAAGLPAHRLRQSARAVFDTVGNMVLGSAQPLSHNVAQATQHWGQDESASVIGQCRRAPVGTAAFVNGTFAHSMDFDDTHLPSVLHPSASVVPAVLAIGEATGAAGPRSLAAIAVGTELCIRLGMAGYDAENANSIFFDRGQHATSICGTIGAAVAAAMLLSGDSRSVVAAASIAASMGSGIIECNRTGGTVKQIHTGWAAHCGIAAAQLAASGITGPPTALEGRFGFFQAFCGTRARPETVTADLGQNWHSDALRIKPYPCNLFTHAGIDAAVELRTRGVRPAEITALRLGVPGPVLRTIAEPAEIKAAPTSGYGGAFSGPYTVAAAMYGGGGLGLYIDDFTDEAVRRPDILALAAKVTCYADPECTALFPRQVPATLTAHLADGRVEESTRLDGRGGPRQPLSDDELSLKFGLNLANALDDDSAGHLQREIFQLASHSSPRSVMRLLRTADSSLRASAG